MSKEEVKTKNTVVQPLKVGFDLDGVLLYNPVRIIRPIIAELKKRSIGIKRKKLQFYKPKSRWEQELWRLFHKSSFTPAEGLNMIKELVDAGLIEAHIVTARFEHLRKDTEEWMEKIGAKGVFSSWHMNEKNEEPHVYKERKIKELNLDVFIEDNWDIVNHLHTVFEKEERTVKRQMLWIYNMLDKKIPHPYKFSTLLSSVEHVSYHFFPPKQIVITVTDYFPPHWTGLSQSIYRLLDRTQDDFKHIVLTIQTEKKLKERETIGKIHVIRSIPWFAVSRAQYSPMVMWEMWKVLSIADTILINSPCTNILFVTLLAKIYGKKVIIFHQGDLILPNGIGNRLIQWTFDWMTQLAMKMADQIATYTQDYISHSRVLKKLSDKTTALLLPIPPNLQTDKQIKKKFSKDTIVIGFAGRFVEEKGFDVLLKAIPKVVETLPNAHFVFAGETQMKYEKFFEEHESLFPPVEAHLSMLGLLKGKQLTDFYNSLDLFILPSRSECFGLVQAEAMQAGVPVICANIPGARELIQQTHFGYLFESEDVNDLAKMIIKAVKNRQTLKKFEHATKEFLRKDETKYKEWLNS